MTYNIRSGDLRPTMQSYLRYANGEDIDPGASAIFFHMSSGQDKITKTVSYDAEAKLATVEFDMAEFPEHGGIYRGYFRIESLGISVPNEDFILIKVDRDIR